MNNFEFEWQGKKYWYSRSMTAVVYVFARDRQNNNEWCILADKRGPGCPTCVGMWNVPCGYLDFNESIIGTKNQNSSGFTEGAALRELREETGVKLTPSDLKFHSLFTLPFGKKQNINCAFYAVLDKDVSEYPTSTQYSEPNEVSDIQWIPISHIDQYEFAFHQRPIIRDIYRMYVNIGWWMKLMLRLSNYLNKKYRNKLVK